jgi:alcohol dehydrogenase (cytochrome c)
MDTTSIKVVWRYPKVGDGISRCWTMTTATGLVFFGDNARDHEADDGKTGEPQWHINTGQTIHASPMSYAVDGVQYIALAAGSDVFSFALPF